MLVVGLDIGYSNLKLVTGSSERDARVLLQPAGAAPVSHLAEPVRAPEEAAGLRVQVDGRPWAAGLSPDRFEGWARPLHADYPTTATYRALFHAALLLSGADRVDRLVTGLPVSQAHDSARRRALQHALLGRQPVAPGHLVEVREVVVLPQPVGAYVDLIWSSATPELLDRVERGSVLVLDAGFFSLDWTLIVRGELRRRASGTTLEAMSVVLETAARLLAEDRGGQPCPGALEEALHAGHPDLLVLGQKVTLAPYLARAAEAVAPVALESLRQALRRESANLDVLLLVGGGASAYAAPIRALFPETPTVTPRDTVTANARGFFRYGLG